MAIGQLLEQIRDYYIDRFVSAINEQSVGQDVTIAHELAFRNRVGDLVTAGQLDLPLRADLIVIRDGMVANSLQIDTVGTVSFVPICFNWPEHDLSVQMGPFQWNWLQLRIYGLPPSSDYEPLREWFMLWFQDDDPRGEELLGGVHFLSDPWIVDGAMQFSIDLGTAPVRSFEELLVAVGRMRPERLSIGQFSE